AVLSGNAYETVENSKITEISHHQGKKQNSIPTQQYWFSITNFPLNIPANEEVRILPTSSFTFCRVLERLHFFKVRYSTLLVKEQYFFLHKVSDYFFSYQALWGYYLFQLRKLLI
ncbi:MAG TPA: hypothetical protein P5236_04840, partial [Paludibacteraceae bacterium]|nr:hypothetical protein [Paludibacteraceae bacterium]